MLIVLQTQLHILQQPTAEFLENNPQAGYQQLLTVLEKHRVQLAGRTRTGVCPHSEEEWLEEASWIAVTLSYAVAHKQELLIVEQQSGANEYYDFRQGNADVLPVFIFDDDGCDDAIKRLIDSFNGNVKYIGTYDDYRTLRQNGAVYYNLDPVFLKHSGRVVDTCVYDQTSHQSFFTQLLFRMSSISSIANNSDIFLKSQSAKRFRQRFTHDEIVHALNHRDSISDKFEQLVYASEVYNAFIITNFIPMHDENRFFVVDNKIIDGARTISSDTPVKHESLGYFQNMRHHNGRVNQELADFAAKMVAEIAEFNGTLSKQPYVIDVAYNESQEPVIVEYNPFFNSGLYGTNPRLLLDALLK